MDIFNTLKEDHESLRTLLEITGKTNGNSSGRQQLWKRLKVELQAHAEAEEQEFYGILKTKKATAHDAKHSIEEHDAIDELIVQLDNLGFDNPEWLNVFGRLDHMVRHHLREEETDLFPVAERVITDRAAERYANAYEETKSRLEAQMKSEHRTTQKGVDERTYESRTLSNLRSLAADQSIEGRWDMSKSELISALRDTPRTDA